MTPALASDVAKLLRSSKRIRAIGLEGAVNAGKSYYAAKLMNANPSAMKVIPEHTVFDPTTRRLATRGWPIKSAAIQRRQRAFVFAEMRRASVARRALRDHVTPIFDRTILSIVGHTYARTWPNMNSARNEIKRLLAVYGQRRRRPVIPATIVYLKPSESLLRSRFVADKATERFLLKPKTHLSLTSFYRSILPRLRGVATIVISTGNER